MRTSMRTLWKDEQAGHPTTESSWVLGFSRPTFPALILTIQFSKPAFPEMILTIQFPRPTFPEMMLAIQFNSSSSMMLVLFPVLVSAIQRHLANIERERDRSDLTEAARMAGAPPDLLFRAILGGESDHLLWFFHRNWHPCHFHQCAHIGHITRRWNKVGILYIISVTIIITIIVVINLDDVTRSCTKVGRVTFKVNNLYNSINMMNKPIWQIWWWQMWQIWWWWMWQIWYEIILTTTVISLFSLPRLHVLLLSRSPPCMNRSLTWKVFQTLISL